MSAHRPITDDNVLALFGAEVRARRTALRLSQEKLGEIAELDPTYIGRVERGEANLSLLPLTRIAAALDTTASVLLVRIA